MPASRVVIPTVTAARGDGADPTDAAGGDVVGNLEVADDDDDDDGENGGSYCNEEEGFRNSRVKRGWVVVVVIITAVIMVVMMDIIMAVMVVVITAAASMVVVVMVVVVMVVKEQPPTTITHVDAPMIAQILDRAESQLKVASRNPQAASSAFEQRRGGSPLKGRPT